MKQQLAREPIKRRASLNQPPQPAYVTNVPTRQPDTAPLRIHRQPHFLVYFGTGMLIVLALYVIWSTLVIPFWQGIEDQWQYGQGRITRFEADVGHGGTSTFFAFVLSRQVIVIEAPGGSMEKAKYYNTAALTGNFSTPPVISLSVADVDGVKNCLIVHVEGTSGSIVLYNTGTGFQMTRPR